jgi:hypothetical protein
MASAKKGAGKEINNGLYAKILEVKRQEKAQEAMKEALSKPEVQKELANIFGEPVIGEIELEKVGKFQECVEISCKEYEKPIKLKEWQLNEDKQNISNNVELNTILTKDLLDGADFTLLRSDSKTVVNNPWVFEEDWQKFENFFKLNISVLKDIRYNRQDWIDLDRKTDILREKIELRKDQSVKYAVIDGSQDGKIKSVQSPYNGWIENMFGTGGEDVGKSGEINPADFPYLRIAFVKSEQDKKNLTNWLKKNVPGSKNKVNIIVTNNYSIDPENVKTIIDSLEKALLAEENPEDASKALANTTTTAKKESKKS